MLLSRCWYWFRVPRPKSFKTASVIVIFNILPVAIYVHILNATGKLWQPCCFQHLWSPAGILSSYSSIIVKASLHCVPKTSDHIFDDKLNYNCPFIKIFGTLITNSTGHRQVFLFSHLSEKPCAQSGGQAKETSVSSLDFAWTCHSLFKCIQKNNSPWSPAHMLQMMSCSAVVWSQSYLPSHSLINNVIVCNKSCYCSIINRKLYNK